MNEIINSETKRQVQPVDFSFLSDADKEVTLAVDKMLRALFGFDDKPIILGAKDLLINTTSGIVNDGLVLHKGICYKVGKISGISIALIKTYPIKIQFIRDIADPSPVFDKNLSKTINCHYRYYGELYQDSSDSTRTGDGIYMVRELNKVGLIATQDAITGVQADLTTLQGTVTALRNLMNQQISILTAEINKVGNTANSNLGLINNLETRVSTLEAK
jgi:hypothetical protein